MKFHALALGALAALVLALPASAAVTSFHSFGGPDGSTPAAPLVQGADGLLYGVAAHGGDLTVLPPDGAGTVFRTDGVGSLTTLHVFRGTDGAVPTGIVQGRDGAFYGTTLYGGGPVTSLEPGNGTIFRIEPSGAATVLFVFPGGENGFRPGPLMQGSDGALYGTAIGGQLLYMRLPGIVYRFDPVTRDYRILHTFLYSYYGARHPTGKLFQAADGFLYGTTREGGTWNAGVVYRVSPAGGGYSELHSFDFNEGSQPLAGVFQASDGRFYGTLEHGGYGGRIFSMDAAGNVTIVHSFGPYGAEGWGAITNPIEGRDGFLYGTTPEGGTASASYGIVYRLAKSGGLTVLHSFTGPDGISPRAGLLQAADGRLYGSTIVGGAFGLGTLFRLDPGSPPSPQPLPTLAWMTLDPATVRGGAPAKGTVTLTWSAPAGGAVVSLASNSPLAAVPSSVTVPAGAKTATFTIATKATKKTRAATITARYNGSQTSALLTLTG